MNKHYIACKTMTCPCLLRFAFHVLLGFFSVTANAGDVKHNFSAPPGKITGMVTDSKNVPIEGVSVVVKGTKRGVTTNSAGVFTLTNVPENATLIFTSTGFG